MTTASIKTELDKLNKSQRTAMRHIVASPLSKLEVERSGWATMVRVESLGFIYLVKLGPRGAILEKKIWERLECA